MQEYIDIVNKCLLSVLQSPGWIGRLASPPILIACIKTTITNKYIPYCRIATLHMIQVCPTLIMTCTDPASSYRLPLSGPSSIEPCRHPTASIGLLPGSFLLVPECIAPDQLQWPKLILLHHGCRQRVWALSISGWAGWVMRVDLSTMFTAQAVGHAQVSRVWSSPRCSPRSRLRSRHEEWRACGRQAWTDRRGNARTCHTTRACPKWRSTTHLTYYHRRRSILILLV